MRDAHTIQELIQKAGLYLPGQAVEKIQEAYLFAKKAHEGQFRRSGEPYVGHPVEVAYILANLEQDVSAICAGLLHDTVEDSQITVKEITEKFGNEVFLLVDGVTKLSRIY